MLKISVIEIPESMKWTEIEHLQGKVSPERQQKISKFYRDEDKVRSLLAELLLRFMIQKHYHLKEDDIEFTYNEHGKPSLTRFNDIFFNLSHSCDRVICGIGNASIGMDVEHCKEKEDLLGISKRFFTDQEHLDLCNSTDEEQTAKFYAYWSLKESYLKAVGKGLSIPLNYIGFQINEDSITAMVDGRENEEYSFRLWDIGDDYSMATCWEGYRGELLQTEIEFVNLDQMFVK